MRSDFFRKNRDVEKLLVDLGLRFLECNGKNEEVVSGNVCPLTVHNTETKKNAEVLFAIFIDKFDLKGKCGYRNVGEPFHKWFNQIDGNTVWSNLSERDKSLMELARDTMNGRDFPNGMYENE